MPQERIQQRTVEQTIDVLVPQVVKEMLGAIQIIPQDRVSERVVEQVVDVRVSQVVEEIVEMTHAIAWRRVQETIEVLQVRFIDKVVDASVVVQRRVPVS